MTVCIVYFFVPVLRDIEDRGRDLEQVLTQYITFVKPAFEEFCLPVSLLPLSGLNGHDTSQLLHRTFQNHRSCAKVLYSQGKYIDNTFREELKEMKGNEQRKKQVEVNERK